MKTTLKQKIDKLAEVGYEVDIIHNRPHEFAIKSNGEVTTKLISPRGGETVAHILADGNVISEGQAYCSIHDNYSKRIGALIALGRAEKKLNV